MQAQQAFKWNSLYVKYVLETVGTELFGCFVCSFQLCCIIIGFKKANQVCKLIVIGEQSFFLFKQKYLLALHSF